jgi:hypothetical protein
MVGIELKDRKEMEAKFASIFHDKLGGLSTELREILLDDMVTAFQNRLNVLNRTSQKSIN